SEKLDKMIEQNHLPHALLITGVEKIGKFDFTQNLIQRLLCNNSSCGECEICKALNNDDPKIILDYGALIRRSHYPNLIYCRTELNDSGSMSKDIRVDQIRAFCESLGKTAETLQIGVIFYADQMNNNAANSLLKTLEEPRKNTLIILLAHNIDRLPMTILSRCQKIHINPTYDQEAAQWLGNQIDENTRQDFDVMQLLESAHGVPHKALEDLQGDYFFRYQGWQNLLLEIAVTPTKISDTEIFSDNELDVLKCLQHLISEGIKIKILNHDGANLELNKVIEKASFNHLFKLLDDTNRAISLSQTTVNMKLLLDNVLVVWSHITNLNKYPAITNFQDY
ncbi:MAG: DNA polymerase III subunit delta', partial [Pseudomonadota bacterium]|nr:DNA polymerase III subunit delta' [Pseudomonadota bacterium]